MNESILVIDDNYMNRKLLKIVLEKEGYLVTLAEDANEAMGSIGKYRPRLILMDIQLPEVDGFELTHRLKSDPKTKDIKILMVTSYDQVGDQEKAKAVGCDGYIHKPIDTQALPAVVERLVRGQGGQPLTSH